MNLGIDENAENAAAAKAGVGMGAATWEPGFFEGGLSVAGGTLGQIGAAIPWGISAAGSGLAWLADKEAGYAAFERTDEIYGRAIDYWTPDPVTVGAGGMVVGQVLGTLPVLLTGPAAPYLLAGSTTMLQGRRLAREGVEGPEAAGVAFVQGVATAVGMAAPAAIGSTLTARVASGAGINVAVGGAADAASAAILDGTEQAQQFDPFNMTARGIDLLLGAAFGGLAHYQARGDFDRQLSTADRDAILAHTNHDNLVNRTGPGYPATEIDAGRQADNVNAAVRQLVETGQVDPALLPHDDITYRTDIPNRPASETTREQLELFGREEGVITDTPVREPDAIDLALREMPAGDPTAPLATVAEAEPVRFADMPEIASVRQALDADPGLSGFRVLDDDGNEVSLRDALDASVREVEEAGRMEVGFQAAAACFLRTLA